MLLDNMNFLDKQVDELNEDMCSKYCAELL